MIDCRATHREVFAVDGKYPVRLLIGTERFDRPIAKPECLIHKRAVRRVKVFSNDPLRSYSWLSVRGWPDRLPKTTHRREKQRTNDRSHNFHCIIP
jgi:hypothetical protein